MKHTRVPEQAPVTYTALLPIEGLFACSRCGAAVSGSHKGRHATWHEAHA